MEGILAIVKDGTEEFKVTRLPFGMRTAGAEARGLVASLGEHNEPVLREWLGYSRDAVEALAQRGILCGARSEAGATQ